MSKADAGCDASSRFMTQRVGGFGIMLRFHRFFFFSEKVLKSREGFDASTHFMIDLLMHAFVLLMCRRSMDSWDKGCSFQCWSTTRIRRNRRSEVSRVFMHCVMCFFRS